MFKIFDDTSTLQIRANDKAVNCFINNIRKTAKSRLNVYDEIILSPNKTSEQRRFLANTRESFKSVLNVGYSFFILGELTQLLPEAMATKFKFVSSDKQTFEKSLDVTYISILAMSQTISELASRKIISLSAKRGVSLANNNGSFLDDGFDYSIENVIKSCVFEILNKNCQHLLDEIIERFYFQNMSPEQNAYYELERLHLLISLKEAYRSSAYTFLINDTIDDCHIMVASMLEKINIERFKLILEIIYLLSKFKIIIA